MAPHSVIYRGRFVQYAPGSVISDAFHDVFSSLDPSGPHPLCDLCKSYKWAPVRPEGVVTITIVRSQWTALKVPKMSFSLCLSSLSVSFYSSLQAVETNLASKDSHWVYANEVRPNTNTLVCTWVNLDRRDSLLLSTQSHMLPSHAQTHSNLQHSVHFHIRFD